MGTELPSHDMADAEDVATARAKRCRGSFPRGVNAAARYRPHFVIRHSQFTLVVTSAAAHIIGRLTGSSTIVRVTINGQSERLDDGTTVAALLRELEVEPVRVAVEINTELVTRSTFESTLINEGDRIEIVTFVGGG